MKYLQKSVKLLTSQQMGRRYLAAVPKGKIINATGDKLLVAGLRGATAGGIARLDDDAQG